MTTTTLSVTSLLEDFVSKFGKSQRTSGGYRVSCPVEGHSHGDRNPSLKVWAGDHRIMAHCYSGLGHTWKDVYAALGIDEKQYVYNLGQNDRQVLDTYIYTGEDGEKLFRVIRYVPKSFAQQKLKPGKDGTHESHWNQTLGDAVRVPYELTKLRAAIDQGKNVMLVEGEKSVDHLMRMGFDATTTPMGAANWKREYARHFKGGYINIIPDNDAPGREYASRAASDLLKVAQRVKIVHLPGLDEGQDIDDWLVFHDEEDLRELIRRTPAFDPDTEGLQILTLSDGIRYHWPAGDVEIEISRLIFENGNVHAEASATVRGERLVVARRINLQSTTAISNLARSLNDRQNDIPWGEYVDEAVNRSIISFREGGRSTKITTERAPGPQWLVWEVLPDMTRPTLLFGDSETSKSVLATTTLVSIAAGRSLLGDMAVPNRVGPVLYLDWEDDEDLFRHRVQLLAQGNDLDLNDISPIHYYHPPGPLHVYVDSLAREIEREGFMAVVIDSRGAAQDGPLSYEAETNRFFDAIQILRRPAIVIDHLAKSELSEGSSGQHSFGSVFTRGRVVMSWRVRRGERGPDQTSIEWACAKWNHGPRLPDRRFVIDWTEGLRVTRELTTPRQHRSMVYDYLSEDGPAGVEVVAASTNLDKDAVLELLRGNDDLFRETESGGWEVVPPAEWAEPSPW